MLMNSSDRKRAAASEVLQKIRTKETISLLLDAYQKSPKQSAGVIATLGRIPEINDYVSTTDDLYSYLEPFQILLSKENWLADESMRDGINFLLKQNIY